jgi:hypothetical protein
LIQYFLSQGANGGAALIAAATRGDCRVVELLLQYEVDVNSRDSKVSSCLLDFFDASLVSYYLLSALDSIHCTD